MSIFLPPIVEKVRRKLKGIGLRSQLKHYISSMDNDNPLKGLPARIVGDAYADPTEFFTHYDAYGYWVAKKLSEGGANRKILDVGSPKMLNAMLSASHDVTAIVLSDCSDRFSAITYVNHDISDPLPFAENTFNCLTSSVSLPLVGLGRYGDRVNSNCLPDFIHELKRIMTNDAELYISLCLGPNFLAYNNGWYLDMETIEQIFARGGWELKEAIVDRIISPNDIETISVEQRFTSPKDAGLIAKGNFRVVFCHFRHAGDSKANSGIDTEKS